MAETPLKILIFSEDFPPDVGGIAQWAFGMATALQRLGQRVAVLTRYREGYRPVSLPETGFPVFWMYGKRWPQLRTWHCRRHLRRYLSRGNRPDLVLATTWNFARGILGLSRRTGFRLVTVAHGLEVTRTMSAPKRRWMRKTFLHSFRVIAVSQFTRSQLVEIHGVPAEKVLVLPNGVDPARFFPTDDVGFLRKRLRLENEKVILTLARVIERKGHDLVIRALVKVRRKVPDLRYVIAGPGDPAYLKVLRELVRQLGLSEIVTFTGPVAAGELNALYNLADVYVMPSRVLPDRGDTEGFGITFLEANACGKPVIGGRSGGVEDAVVDGQTGYLVDPDNPDELAEKLERLLLQPDLARRLGERGRRRVEQNLSWDRIAERFLAGLKV